MRLGFAGAPFMWYISQPAKCGPPTVHFSRLPSEDRMNAPFLVPTSTRTLLMKSSSPYFSGFLFYQGHQSKSNQPLKGISQYAQATFAKMQAQQEQDQERAKDAASPQHSSRDGDLGSWRCGLRRSWNAGAHQILP